MTRYEAFLRIDDHLDAKTRMRARIIFVTGWAFVGIQLINMLTMLYTFGGIDDQHYTTIVSCCAFIGVTHALRWTKNPWFYGSYYTILTMTAIVVSATTPTDTSIVLGINAPILMMMAAAMAYVAFIGNLWTSALYVVTGLIVIVYLRFVTVAGVTTDFDVMLTNRKAVQAALSLLLIAIICCLLSTLSFRNVGQLESALIETKTSERKRNDLMNMMTHEIRTPLNGIIGLSDLLGKRQLDPTGRQYIDLIQSASANLLMILNEALDRAKHDNADLTITSAPFDPALLLSEICELFRATAEQKGLWIGAHGLEDLPEYMIGDAPHLRQILSNLLGNALKFTQTGGVRIGAVMGQTDGETADVMFFVQDTGLGIAPEEQGKVFERFEQSASAHSTSVKGSGLGLTISHDLVKAMGGDIRLESEVGKGSTFFFTLTLGVTQSDRRPVQAEKAISV